MRRRLVVTAAALMIALSGCDSGPKAGELVVQLTSGRSDLAAIAFAVTALEPRTVEGVTADCSGCEVHIVTVDERETRGVVIAGQAFAPGAVLRVAVSDVNEPSVYGIRALEVAANDLTAVPLHALQLHLTKPR